jgi:hypothetical protein
MYGNDIYGQELGKGGATFEVGMAVLPFVRVGKLGIVVEEFVAKGGNRSFWSGAGTEAKALGEGFETLGQTRAGKNLIKLTEGMDYYPAMNGQPASQAYQWWARLSTQYAKGASGTIHVFQNAEQGVGMKSIWALYEYPALLKNPNVTEIIFH